MVNNMNKYLSLIIAFILSVITLEAVYANNVGVYGQVYPIIENDFLDFIYQRLYELEKNGELAHNQHRFLENVKTHTLTPTPVSGLTTTVKPRIFYYDPTLILRQDITDQNRKILLKKGMRVNP